MPGRQPATRGLTIAELLIFLSLASLLAAIGMYGLARYLRHSRTTEAVSSVTTMGGGAAKFYDSSDESQPKGTDAAQARATRHFPPSSTQSVPPDPLDVRGKKYQSTQADWAGSPWNELRFSIPQAQYYAYSFQSEGAGDAARASAIAKGDLDADGHGSQFDCVVRPDDQGRAQVDPHVRKSNPEE